MDAKAQVKLKSLTPIGVRHVQAYIEERISDLHNTMEKTASWDDVRFLQGRITELRHFSSVLSNLDNIEETLSAQ